MRTENLRHTTLSWARSREMSGVSGKRGRGGAGGAFKRNNISAFRPPPPILRSSAAPGGRLSLGSGAAGPRNRSTAVGPAPSAPSNAAEETFSLVSGNPLHFAMIIRLAPDLVEEIKRTEAHGGTTRIKFGANANNSAGNVSFHNLYLSIYILLFVV